jgi:excisionase family DNA binding protein
VPIAGIASPALSPSVAGAGRRCAQRGLGWEDDGGGWAADIGDVSERREGAEFATVTEFARLLGLDRKTVYAAIQRGEIAGVYRLGRAIKIHVRTAFRAQGIEPRW